MKRFVLGTILFFALAATGCGGGTPAALTRVPSTSVPVPTLPPTSTPAPTATPLPPTATPIPTSANPLEALTKAFRGWAGTKSFRAKATTIPAPPKKGTPTPPTEMTLEVVMPDRIHIIGASFEAYKIGSTFYTKIGTQWQKSTVPARLDFSFVDLKKIEDELGATKETKFLGPEILDGIPTLVYQYTTTIKTPVTATTVSKVWIGVADQLPRKSEALGQSGSKTTTLYYDYNANIIIEAPIK